MKKLLLVFVLFSALFTVGVFAQTDDALPGAGITPDSPFYFLDKLGEAIRGLFAFSDDAKMELQIKFAAERISEIKVILETKGVEAKGIEIAEERLGENLNRIEEILAQAKTKGKDIDVLKDDLENKIESRKKSLEDVFENHKEKLEDEKDALENLLDQAEEDEDEALVLELEIKLEELEIQEELLEEGRESVLEEFEDLEDDDEHDGADDEDDAENDDNDEDEEGNDEDDENGDEGENEGDLL